MNRQEEIEWKYFGKNNKYRANKYGKIQFVRNGEWFDKTLKQEKKKGSMTYYLKGRFLGFNTQKVYFHRIIAELFITNKDNKPFVDHIDGDGLNNNISNLRWVTHAENIKHAAQMGRFKVDRPPFKGKFKEMDYLVLFTLKKANVKERTICEKMSISLNEISNLWSSYSYGSRGIRELREHIRGISG